MPEEGDVVDCVVCGGCGYDYCGADWRVDSVPVACDVVDRGWCVDYDCYACKD